VQILQPSTNLYKKSAVALREVITAKSFISLKRIRKKTYILAIYGSINYLLIATFLYYVLIVDPLSVLHFPVNIYKFSIDVYRGYQIVTVSSLLKFVLPFFFYYMLFQYIKLGIKRYKRKHGGKINL
jgi:putative peptide zinc metalloprotease protein